MAGGWAEGSPMDPPRVQVWAYPWDVAALGPARTAKMLSDAGVDAVSMTAVYHVAQILSLAGDRPRIVSPPAGVPFWRADPSLLPAPLDRRPYPDFLAEVRDAFGAAGIALRAWTLVHHDAVGLSPVLNAFRHRLPHAPCPVANADYLPALVDEVSAQGAFSGVELESAGFTTAFHGGHHDIAGVHLTPLGALFLSACFCRSCVQRLGDGGVDMARLRQTVRQDAASLFDQDGAAPGSEAVELAAYLSRRPEVAQYLRVRAAVVSEGVARAARHHPELAVAVMAHSSAHTPRLAWLDGIATDPSELANRELLVLAYGDARRVADDVRHFADLGWSADRLVVGQTLVQEATPALPDALARLEAAMDAGGRRFSFYNLGILSPARRGWLGRLARRIRS